MKQNENLTLSDEWDEFLLRLGEIVGKKPADMNAVLFLIGVQELGKGAQYFSKDQKQDLMHIGVCKVLSLSGYYEFTGLDKDNWPHWNLVKPLPFVDVLAQESFLQMHVLEYFKNELGG